ncbi:cysteine hydrolase family protein [Chloroflexota bacterium]
MNSKPLLSLEEKIKPGHTAIIVVDMQNDYCSPEGAVSGKHDWRRVQAIIPRFRNFLDKARENQVRIIFIQTNREEHDLSGPELELRTRWGRKGCVSRRGSWGAKFDDNLQPRDADTIVEKTKYSAFTGTDLDDLLKGWGVRTLVMTGVSTCTCVETTTRDGFMRDYYIILAKDLTAAYDESL